MIFSVEVKNIHDLIMLDAIISAWKDKFDSEETEEVEDDDAENESEDRDDESEETAYERMFPETEEEKAHRKALESLAKCLRDNGIADISINHIYDVHRRKNRG